MIKTTMALSLSALVLAACSGGASSNQDNQTAATATPQEPTEKQASVLDCLSQPRPDARPDNDIMDIDIGMTADDAVRIAKCNKDGFTVEVLQRPLPDGSQPRNAIQMKKGDDLVNVFLLGMPGSETVYGVVRVKKFAEGEEPTLDQMRGKLTGKYGPLIPHRAFGPDGSFNAQNPNEQAQAFTPEGQAIADNKLGDADSEGSRPPIPR